MVTLVELDFTLQNLDFDEDTSNKLESIGNGINYFLIKLHFLLNIFNVDSQFIDLQLKPGYLCP